MRTIAIALAAVVALMIIGCQPPEGMGGVTQEQFDQLKAQVETLQTDVGNLQTALDSLTTVYNEHIDKFHKKGGTKAPKPPAPQKPPQVGR
jgi:outer membrane murein-binding lipoprotein Lpp